MSDRAEILRQFSELTGAPEDRCRFFLDSANWQLEVALSSFFENGGNTESGPEPSVVVSSDDSQSPPPARVRPRIATLGTLQQADSSDEEEGQAFYAGGSERSGQQILGPNRGRSDFVTEMFKNVRARGALVAEEEEESRGRPSVAFGGTGYRLGQTADDHTVVPGAQNRSQGPRSVQLHLYREGFTVDSGPLRHYTEPENAAFLNYIQRGDVPPELASEGEVRVSLQDRRHDTYTPGKTQVKPFTGKGQVLGSPTPPTVGATAPVAATSSDRQVNERAAITQLGLDDSRPVTNIQIRLADGTRLVAKFNHTHTIQDVRNYIITAAPEYQVREFTLLTAFPSSELKEPNKSLADADLLNSVIVARVLS